MPEIYEAHVRCNNPKTGEVDEKIWMPILLVVEMCHWLVSSGSINFQKMCSFEPGSAAQLLHQKPCRHNETPPNKTVVIGIHGDGVETQRQQSCEVISWNLPTLPWAERLLFTCVEKEFLCGCDCKGRHTVYDLLQVFVWCLMAMIRGVFPEGRHDGQPWRPSDRKAGRHKRAGKSLGFFGALEQCRGDWPWHKFIFGFPGWNADAVCWMCEANRSDVPWYDFRSCATWRGRRHNQGSFMAMLRQSCSLVCPLFKIPGFVVAMIVVDVLHTCDLGVTQEVIGSVFFEALMHSG